MYKIEIYETSMGNRPLEEYFAKLLDDHKDSEILKIDSYIRNLEKYGFEIRNKVKNDSIKPVDKEEKIFELRPSSSRVFFFFYDGGEAFVLLHAYEKKQNKADKNEIRKAIKEKKDYLKRRN